MIPPKLGGYRFHLHGLTLILLTLPLLAQTPATTSAPPPLEIIKPVEAQFEQAGIFFSQKRYADALQSYSALLPQLKDSRREEALYRMAESYRVLGKNTEALGVYDLLVQSYPESLFAPVSRYRLGELYYQAKEWVKAEKAFIDGQAKADAVTLVALRFYLALTQAQLDQWEKALPVLQEFTAQTGSYRFAAAQVLAQYFQTKSEWKESLRLWAIVLDGSTDKALQAQAAANAGWVAWQEGDGKAAEGFFLRCRKIDSKSDWNRLANTGLVQIYYQQGRDRELLDLFNKNREFFLGSARAEILLFVARAHFRLHDPINAVRGFDVFLSQFKDHAAAPLAAYERLLARQELSVENVNGDTAAYLAAYGKSEFSPYVSFLRAMDFSRRRQFVEARPMWQELSKNPPPQAPQETIWLELIRAQVETKNWAEVASSCAEFIRRFPTHSAVLSCRVNRAVALQNLPDKPAALAAWQEVKASAPEGSRERQTAYEQIVVLLAPGGASPELLIACRELFASVPKSTLRPLAAYTLGDHAFTKKNYEEAEPLLLLARGAEPKTWFIPATFRLAWGAYAQKETEKLVQRVNEYDKAIANDAAAERLPAAFYYWLGSKRVEQMNWAEAATYFSQTLSHPAVGDLQTSTWWQLGEVQRRLKRWADSVKSIETYRTRDTATADSSVVLLSLAEAQTGAGLYAAAKETIEKTLLQEFEGRRNAQARLLQAEWHLAQKNYRDAAKCYTTLALIYRDNEITPQALRGAAEMWEKVGDNAQAVQYREKLEKEFPINKIK